MNPNSMILLLDDEDSRIWDIRLEPGEKTGVIRHDLWYSFMHLHGDRILVAPEPDSGGEITEPTEYDAAPENVALISPGGRETIANVGGKPYRGIIIELKKLNAQRGYSPTANLKCEAREDKNYDVLKAMMVKIPLSELGENVGTDLHYEDDEVAVWSLNMVPGRLGELHLHTHWYVLVVAAGDVTGVYPNPLAPAEREHHTVTTVCIGRTEFTQPGGSHMAINLGNERYRAFQIVYKQFEKAYNANECPYRNPKLR